MNNRVVLVPARRKVAFGILSRISYPEIPPRIEYVVTPFGKKFLRILNALKRLQKEIGTRR